MPSQSTDDYVWGNGMAKTALAVLTGKAATTETTFDQDTICTLPTLDTFDQG